MTARHFDLLLELYGDAQTNEIFSERSVVQSWLDVEIALAMAQADLGILTVEQAQGIAKAARFENIDLADLWSQTRVVGYPILPLIRQVDMAVAVEHRGRIHFGATTQDIMDTGLVLQLSAASARQCELLDRFAGHFVHLAQAHEATATVARTHAQQAVPMSLGAKFAVYLSELARHRKRLTSAAKDVKVLSLFGAGGTSASYGEQAGRLRRAMAARLGLEPVDVPWHVSRDSLEQLASVAMAIAATAARFAREIVDLSRTEIGELAEADGYLRGASSTMPQKTNPIESEAVIGLAVSAGTLGAAMLRAMEAGHERSAGEWQIEWHVLPQLMCLTNAALLTVGTVAAGLQVFPDRMRANLSADGGANMAEAYMMRLAPALGREVAHELVYNAVRSARERDEPLVTVLNGVLSPEWRPMINDLSPEDYLGDPASVIAAAVREWHEASDDTDTTIS